MVNSLQDDSYSNIMKAIKYSLFIISAVFFLYGIPGSIYLGKGVEGNCLKTIGTTGHFESYILRLIFLAIIVSHVMYIFFSAKESLLIVVDEFQRQSISKALYLKFSIGKELGQNTPSKR